ncbi:MAG: transcription antitermination factor NusB [Clostridia bacterium]|nr:transcription antitermination factor NusB [Clostridia bacterium]
MDRTTARAHAMKLIYEWEMGGDGGEDTRIELLEVEPDENESDFMNGLFAEVCEKQSEIDAMIEKYSRGWTIERMSRVDLAILRLGTCELLRKELSPGIVINEAIELANTYSTEKAGGFINGILGNIGRELNA